MLLNEESRMPFQKSFGFQILSLIREQDGIVLNEDAYQKHSVMKKYRYYDNPYVFKEFK